jgi:eukaryotic-like serine/threonine-protein kinase
VLCRACGDPHPEGTTVCPRLVEPTPVTSGPCNTQIDRYLVERFLGGGGMGAVYRARHVMLDQLMALKLLKAGLGDRQEILDRFVREARAAAAIGNPHIVRVSDFGIAPDGRAFLAMELLDGRDVEQALKQEGPIAPGRAVGIVLQALDGLGAAHAAGIVHRDLKPGNIFLLPVPGGELVKLVDFGVSKMGMGAPTPSLTQTGSLVGTPLYMAPEQLRGARDVDLRADLYAMGVTLFEMLSGRSPWDAPSYESLILAVYGEPPRPLRGLAPHVPAELE